MVPFLFGAQTAEKMKSLVNPSNISFKTFRGLSHSACPEVSVGGGWGQVRVGSHQCLAFWLFSACFCWRRKWWISNGSSRSSFRPSEMSELRGRHSEPSDCSWTSSEALWDASIHTFTPGPLEPQGTGTTSARKDLNGTTLRPDVELSVNAESQ